MERKFINKIIQGDCLNVLSKISSNSVDMTFADPPFNLKKKYTTYRDSKEQREYLEWCYQWITEMVRITKPTGSIFLHNIPRWLSYYTQHLNNIAYFRHWISWNAGGSPLGKTLLPNHYGILYYTKSNSYKEFKFYDIRHSHARCKACKEPYKDYGGKKYLAHQFGPLIPDVWNDIHRIRHRKRRDEHPCQLPVPLLERLILMTTDVDDIVLDPFMGTGTTGVAAKQLGRKYIGIDIDSDYIKIAENNIDKAIEAKIGDRYVSMYLNTIKTIRDMDYKYIQDHNLVSPLKIHKQQNALLPISNFT